METELLVEIKKEQVYVVLTQANIEARLQSSIAGGLSDGKWHTLTSVSYTHLTLPTKA